MGSLYRFFSNKEAVLVALIERWLQSIMQTTEKYIAEQPPAVDFSELIQGLFLVNSEIEYIHSAAYQEVFSGASTVPVLGGIFERHQRRIAEKVTAVYMTKNVNNKSKTQVVEFCVFLHGVISSALAIIADLRKKDRARHIIWVNQMIKGAISSFESE